MVMEANNLSGGGRLEGDSLGVGETVSDRERILGGLVEYRRSIEELPAQVAQVVAVMPEDEADVTASAREAEAAGLTNFVGLFREGEQSGVIGEFTNSVIVAEVAKGGEIAGLAKEYSEFTTKLRKIENAKKQVGVDGNQEFLDALVRRIAGDNGAEELQQRADLIGDEVEHKKKELNGILGYWNLIEFPKTSYLSGAEVAKIVGDPSTEDIAEEAAGQVAEDGVEATNWSIGEDGTIIHDFSGEVAENTYKSGKRGSREHVSRLSGASKALIDLLAERVERGEFAGMTAVQIGEIIYADEKNGSGNIYKAAGLLTHLKNGNNKGAMEYLSSTYPGLVLQVGKLRGVATQAPSVYRFVRRGEEDLNLVVPIGDNTVQDEWKDVDLGEANTIDGSEVLGSANAEDDATVVGGGSEILPKDRLAFLEGIHEKINMGQGGRLSAPSFLKVKNDTKKVLEELQRYGVELREGGVAVGEMEEALQVSESRIVDILRGAIQVGAIPPISSVEKDYGAGVSDRYSMSLGRWTNALLAMRYEEGLAADTWKLIDRVVLAKLREMREEAQV